jgi:hypothetical protein
MPYQAQFCPTAYRKNINRISPIVDYRDFNLGWTLFKTIFLLLSGCRWLVLAFRLSSQAAGFIRGSPWGYSEPPASSVSKDV